MKINTAVRIAFPILDDNGDPVTGAANLDSEYSLNGANFADCNNEAVEIGVNSGVYYLDLVAAETNSDLVAIQIKTSTVGAKTSVLVFYPAAQTLDELDANVDTILSRVTAAVATEAKQDIIDGIVDTIVGRVTANVATEAKQDIIDGVVDTILVDTNEIQASLADGGFTDLLIDAIKARTDVNATEAKQDIIDGIVDTIVGRVTANVATEAKQDIIDGNVDNILADTATIVWGDITTIDTVVDGIAADVGVFPTANYATVAAYVEDIRTRLIAIVGDTNEVQISLANGGFTDLLIDGIKARTDVNATEAKQDIIDGIVDTIVGRVTANVATEAKQDVIDGIVDNILLDTDALEKIATNRWKIVANQLIVYDDDKVTPIYTFNLFSAGGAPVMENVYERVDV